MDRSLFRRGVVLRLAAVLTISLASLAAVATGASAASKSHVATSHGVKSRGAKSHGLDSRRFRSHGQLLHLAPPGLRLNANSSSNWFGYNQGTLEQGNKLFNSITGDWTVPTATQHASGQAEDSSDWIGIGGGCIDAGCTLTDGTLIQTGTEQDVSSSGAPSYSAWYELVPAPSLTVSMTVAPGDHMHASIAEVVPDSNVWNITLQDVTRGETFNTTVPYTSTHTTAEWIEETPLIIGTNAGFAALPDLTNPGWNSASVNGASAGLKPSEEMDLVDSNGNVIGAPSAPNATADGFDECTWTSTCS